MAALNGLCNFQQGPVFFTRLSTADFSSGFSGLLAKALHVFFNIHCVLTNWIEIIVDYIGKTPFLTG
jgi:hypothetical protein